MQAWVLVVALLSFWPAASASDLQPLPADWQSLTAVPAEVLDGLQREVVQVAARPGERMERLVAWMFSPAGLAFEYDNARTRSVAETLNERRGNCLSFTLAFVVLAREAGLNAYLQETDDVLVWAGRLDSNLVFHTGHVNAGVRIGGQQYTVDFEPNLVLSRNRPKRIDDRIGLAHFLNNRGAESLERNQLHEALAHFQAALAIEPGFEPGLNNVGVASIRLGDARSAERAYLTVLTERPNHLPALSNLVTLYRRQGQTTRLQRYETRLARLDRRDPYRTFVRGLLLERQGDYEAALGAYQRAARLHAGEPQFHLGMARAHARLGNAREAGRQGALAKSVRDGSSGGRDRAPFPLGLGER